MKLHAFNDRLESDPDKAQHHAMDVYRIVSMMTETQYDSCKKFLASNAELGVVETAKEIVRNIFSQPDSVGITKIREHALYRREFRLEAFISALLELF